MSSLRTLIKKNKVMLMSRESTGHERTLPYQLANSFINRIVHHETIAINAQNVLNSLVSTGGDMLPPLSEIEDATPPFRWTWVEAILPTEDSDSIRIGCLTQRNDSEGCVYTDQFQSDARKLGNLQSEGPYRHTLLMVSFIEYHGMIKGPLGMAGVLTDEYGEPQGWAMCPFAWDQEDDQTGQELSLQLISYSATLALESFAWLNTQGTKLVAEKQLCGNRNNKKREVMPMSAWHTIVVNLPKAETSSENNPAPSDSSGCREHAVRAHRADYRHGAGLFGRIKALIWVPDHKRGRPELGTIISSYNVGKR